MIVLYGSPVLAYWIRMVISFGRKNRIPVVFDCVDWIEKSGFDSRLKNILKIHRHKLYEKIFGVQM